MSKDLDFHVDLMRTVLWQYENAPRVKSIVGSEQAWADENQAKFWRDWVRDVFDLTTANHFGLNVWARILDMPLVVERPAKMGGNWGFGSHHRNFGRGNFGRASASDIALSTKQARTILLMRWSQITTRPSVPNINRALEMVFGEGAAWVQDRGDMGPLTFIFSQKPSYQIVDLLRNTDLLPRPAAVDTEYLVIPRPSWGFGEYRRNFGRGNFGRRETIT